MKKSKESNRKYPTFKSFLAKLNSLDPTPFVLGSSIKIDEQDYYFDLEFYLDGIHIKIIYSRFEFEKCQVISTMSGKKVFFEKSEKYLHVIDMAMEWIYTKYFQYPANQLAIYKVFRKDIFKYKMEFIHRDDQFEGKFAAPDFDTLLNILEEKGYMINNLIIEKEAYNFKSFKNSLEILDLN